MPQEEEETLSAFGEKVVVEAKPVYGSDKDNEWQEELQEQESVKVDEP